MLNLNAFDGMTAVYHDAGEREIRAVVLYVNASKLYVDEAHETEVAHDVALELCEKGFARIYDTDTFYAPTSFKDAAGTLTIGYGASKTVTVTDPSI